MLRPHRKRNRLLQVVFWPPHTHQGVCAPQRKTKKLFQKQVPSTACSCCTSPSNRGSCPRPREALLWISMERNMGQASKQAHKWPVSFLTQGLAEFLHFRFLASNTSFWFKSIIFCQKMVSIGYVFFLLQKRKTNECLYPPSIHEMKLATDNI